MKYPCADGVDRDAAIEHYLKLERERLQTMEGIGVLTKRCEDLQQEMSDILDNRLGAVGFMAMRAVGKC